MKLIAIVDESALDEYENNNLLIKGEHRNYALFPICKETLITKDGVPIYLTDGHIECLMEYERKKALEMAVQKTEYVTPEEYTKYNKFIGEPCMYPTAGGLDWKGVKE